MNAQALLIIFFRWMHVMTATVAVGSLFFFALILPVGLKVLEPSLAMQVLLKCRRVFKMVIHPSILLFLISGIYNLVMNMPQYKASIPYSHMFLGLHILMALAMFVIALIVLAPKVVRPNHPKLMLINVVLMVLIVAAGSTLKYVREHPGSNTASVAGK